MALGSTRAVGLHGIVGFVVEVEADVAQGLPNITITGKPDTACAQSADRLRAAASNSGTPLPPHRITVNLSPASVPKVGSGFDLGIAVAVLAAAGTVPGRVCRDVVHIGELGLDGSVRAVLGVLPLVLAARRAGCRHVVVPVANAREARLVPGVLVHPVARLDELVSRYSLLAQGLTPTPVDEPAPALPARPAVLDLADVVGQLEARQALEIAAAGGHHLYLVGPPGAGKTMLAERLPGLLPELDDEAAMEATGIASVMGLLGERQELIRQPPFVAPHHGASVAALTGGGSGARVFPGAVTAAHHGVLFLDEAPEFRNDALQALRTPAESGVVLVNRAQAKVAYPSRFQLVLAANPCPCGKAMTRGALCECSSMTKRRYLARLRGPLLDRIDLRVVVEAPTRASLARASGEGSAPVAARVAAARVAARTRWQRYGWQTSAQVPGMALRTGPWALPPSVTARLDRAMDRQVVSMRGYDRCLRVAWTVADLAGRDRPGPEDIVTALTLRADEELAA